MVSKKRRRQAGWVLSLVSKETDASSLKRQCEAQLDADFDYLLRDNLKRRSIVVLRGIIYEGGLP